MDYSVKELLAVMVEAPVSEIEGMAPATAAECAVFLGLGDEPYSHLKHYPLLLAKLRRTWALALIVEATSVLKS